MIAKNVYTSVVHLVLAASGILLLAGSAAAQPQFKGYVENRLYLTFIDNDFNPADYRESLRWGDYNRARVQMSADVSARSYVNLSVDYFTYHGYLLQQLRQAGSGGNPVQAAAEQRVNVDRLYFKLYFSRADVTIGRQRIAWGQSLLWSPFDVFNRVNFLEPQEEKAGVNAFRVSIPTGVTSSIEAVFSPESTCDESRTGIRFLWNMYDAECTGTAIHNVINTFTQNIYGFSFKTDIVLGVWFEGAYFDENPLSGAVFSPRGYFRWLAGADYSFNPGRKMYLMAEFSHDESGETDSKNYNYLSAVNRGRSLLARDYLYGMVQITQSDLTSFNLGMLANLNDGSVILMPGLSHSLFPNTALTLGMYLAVAGEGTEFNPSSKNDPFNYGGNSIVYCWFKLFL